MARLNASTDSLFSALFSLRSLWWSHSSATATSSIFARFLLLFSRLSIFFMALLEYSRSRPGLVPAAPVVICAGLRNSLPPDLGVICPDCPPDWMASTFLRTSPTAPRIAFPTPHCEPRSSTFFAAPWIRASIPAPCWGRRLRGDPALVLVRLDVYDGVGEGARTEGGSWVSMTGALLPYRDIISAPPSGVRWSRRYKASLINVYAGATVSGYRSNKPNASFVSAATSSQRIRRSIAIEIISTNSSVESIAKRASHMFSTESRGNLRPNRRRTHRLSEISQIARSSRGRPTKGKFAVQSRA